MSKNIRIHELTNLKDFVRIISVLADLSKGEKQVTKDELIASSNYSNDKITECLNLLNIFDLVNYYRNSVISFTNYGSKSLKNISKNLGSLSHKNYFILAPFYRKVPIVMKTLDLFLSSKKKKIDSFTFDYFLSVNQIKDVKWIFQHLKGLSLIKYSKYKNAIFTEEGKILFQLFIIERALYKFGRDLFKKKIFIDKQIETKIKDFIAEKQKSFSITYPETLSIISLLENIILGGGVKLLDHDDVIEYRHFVKYNYKPNPRSRIALLLPCAKGKPFSSSRTHKRIHNVLNGLIDPNKKCKNLDGIEEFIVSEPIGIIPRKFELIYPSASYDMTLDAWLPLDSMNNEQKIEDVSQFFSSIPNSKKKSLDIKREKSLVIEKISNEVYEFLEEHSYKFDYIVAYMRSTHRLMVEKAAKKANVDVIFVPSNEEMNKLRKNFGPVSWSLRGLRNTETLNVLLERLNSLKC